MNNYKVKLLYNNYYYLNVFVFCFLTFKEDIFTFIDDINFLLSFY